MFSLSRTSFVSLCQLLDNNLKEIVEDSKYLFEDVEKKDAAKVSTSEVDISL